MKSTEVEKRDLIETDIQVDPAKVEDENTQPEDTKKAEKMTGRETSVS